jgi:hypothetical protein
MIPTAREGYALRAERLIRAPVASIAHNEYVDPYSYPLARRLARPVFLVAGCVGVCVVGAVGWYGSRMWLAIPLGMIGFVAACLVIPAFIIVGDDTMDRWAWLAALSPLLLYLGVTFAVPAWYDAVAARPEAAVVTDDWPGGPGYQQVGLRTVDGDDLGMVWVEDDRDLVVGDRMVVNVDRWGWGRSAEGPENGVVTTLGRWLIGVGLAGFVVLLVALTLQDRHEFRGREQRRDGRSM